VDSQDLRLGLNSCGGDHVGVEHASLQHSLRLFRGGALLRQPGLDQIVRLCGPLANSRFHHQPKAQHRPNSRLETAYHHADKAIQTVVDLLAAA
jgi:hypothetical protein